MKKESVLDCLREKLRAYITRLDAMIFGSAFTMAMLVHLYVFTNKFINHDDVVGLYGPSDFSITCGRWLLQVMCGLTGSLSNPWLIGVMGALFLALACVLIARLLCIQRLLPALLMSISLVAFPSVASTYAYMFCSAAYLFALTAAVLAASLIRTEKLWGYALGAVAIALSMGCYQAYFPLTAALLVTCLILDVCDDRWDGNWKAFFCTALPYVSTLVAGIALYLVVTQIILAVTGLELTDYGGINSMAQITPSVLLQRLTTAYQSYARFFQGKDFAVFYQSFYPYARLCIAADLLAVIACVMRRKLYRQTGMMISLLLLLAAFPLSSSLIYVMTVAEGVHTLMIYPLVITLILPGVILDRLTFTRRTTIILVQRAKMGLALALICLELICGYEGVLVTNRAYFCMDITYENVYAYYTKLTAKIELQEGYTPERTVAMIGRATMPNSVPETDLTGVLVGDNALNIYSIDYLLSYYMATSYNFASQEIKDAICQREEFLSMPCYPAQGSIATIDGIIVVKFSNFN